MSMEKVFVKIVFDDDKSVVLNYYPKGDGGSFKDLYDFVANSANLSIDDFDLHLGVEENRRGRKDLVMFNPEWGPLGEAFEYYHIAAAGPVHVVIRKYGDPAESFLEEDDGGF